MREAAPAEDDGVERSAGDRRGERALAALGGGDEVGVRGVDHRGSRGIGDAAGGVGEGGARVEGHDREAALFEGDELAAGAGGADEDAAAAGEDR